MSINEIQDRSWPSEYAGRFGSHAAVFLEEEYGSDTLACFEHKGDLNVSGDALRAELSRRAAEAGRGGWMLLVDGSLTVDGFLDLEGNHSLAVTGNLACEDLYADSYTYVSVAGDLKATRAVVSGMMSDCGIAVDGTVEAQFIGTAMHAAHHITASADAIMLSHVSSLLADGVEHVRKNLIERLRAGEHPFKVSLDELRQESSG